MRNIVASHYGGHAFEKRFLDMDFLQLRILYEQVIQDRQQKNDDKLELIKVLNNFWTKKMDIHFDTLLMFVNPEAYKLVEEQKQLKVLQAEVKTEEFPDMWNDLMAFIPETYEVSDIPEVNPIDKLPPVDTEMEETFGKWESKSNRFSHLRENARTETIDEPISGWDPQSTTGFTPTPIEEG
jgi:hypothetical protein